MSLRGVSFRTGVDRRLEDVTIDHPELLAEIDEVRRPARVWLALAAWIGFLILTAAGFALIRPAYGLIAAGIGCGLIAVALEL